MKVKVTIAKPSEKGRGWWVFWAVVSVALFVAALLYQSASWEDARAMWLPEVPVWPYWSVFASSWVVLSGLLVSISKQPGKATGPGAAWCVLAVALVARVVVVCGTQPVLSDDIWRYIHDGATLGNGVNPYASAPDDLSASQVPLPGTGVMGRINNPELVTIYQPTSQYVFAALDRVWELSPSAWQRWDANHDKVFRFGFVLFDMAIIGLILWQLRSMGRSEWWATSYAWHPLAISEVAGSGHQDVIGIAFLLLALVLAGRLVKCKEGEALSRKRLYIVVLAGGAFGLAVGVKPVVLPIALALAWTLRHRPRMVALSAGATVLTGAAIYLPFVFMDGGLAGMIETTRTFIDKWSFNASAYDVVSSYVVGKPWVDYSAAAVLLAVIVLTLSKKLTGQRPDAARSAGAFLFASLLVSSTVHPWYLLWALALLPWYFSPALWVLSLTVVASYAAHLTPGYRIPLPIVIGEYLPVYALLVWSVWGVWENYRRKPDCDVI
jgi:hypothetical protein